MISKDIIKVLHLNDKIEISGGVETNISHLCSYSSDYEIETEWLGIYEKKSFVIRSFCSLGFLTNTEGYCRRWYAQEMGKVRLEFGWSG